MGLTTGLVALALWGADPVPPPVQPADDTITCEVQVMTVEGLGWRTAAYSMLKPAARQGSATIWTADRQLKATLEQASVGQSIKAPKVSTVPHAVATVNSDKVYDYIRHLEKSAVAPTAANEKLIFKPEMGTIREGFKAVFSGQRFDQGIMTKVIFAESHIGSMHTVDLTNKAIVFEGNPAEVGRQILSSVFTGTPPVAAASIQVPEVFVSEIQGEWLVPNDGILVISMGVNTVANAAGKAVVNERLAIFDFARPVTDNGVTQTALTPACRVDANTAVAMENAASLGMPVVPDRSYPEARDKDGNIYELPPLPEAYASADLNQIAPGSPLATPQSTPITRPNRMISDPQLARTSLEAIPDREIDADAPYLYGHQATQPAGLAAAVESFLRKGMVSPAVFQPTPLNAAAEVDAMSCAATHSGDTAAQACDTPDCPAAGCPFAAAGCNEAAGMPPATSLAWQAAVCNPTGSTPPPARSTQPLGVVGVSPAVPVIDGKPAQVQVGVDIFDQAGFVVSGTQADLSAAFQAPGSMVIRHIPLGNGLSLQVQARVVGNAASTVAQGGPAAQPAPAAQR